MRGSTSGRAEMRTRLREWGGHDKLTRELERDMRAAGREYDIAMSELRDAKRREDDGPRRGRAHAAARRATRDAEDIAQRYRERYDALRRQVDLRAGANAAMDAALEALDEREQLVLRMRYARGMSWLAIAIACGCEESGVRRIERAAVDRLSENTKRRGG